jgi:hypothetical protein
MEIVGVIEWANLGGPDGSIVWGTYEATGEGRPNIYRQSTRHEVAVSAVSARYINAGFTWRRDERPQYVGGHQADGVAIGLRSQELIEVELTPKRAPRYASIFTAFRDRLARGDATRIAYICNARAVRAALTASAAGRAIAPGSPFEKSSTVAQLSSPRPSSRPKGPRTQGAAMGSIRAV